MTNSDNAYVTHTIRH